MIIDADGHYIEDVDEWAKRVPRAAAEFAPRLAVEDDGVERFSIGDLYALPSRNANLMGGLSIGDGMNPRDRTTGRPELRGRRVAQGAPAGLVGAERLTLMDEEGIAVSVLFPTLALGALPSLTVPKAASALSRALNDWVIESFASSDPTRLLPVATIPLHDPTFAAQELRRCVVELGMKAAWVSPVPVMGRMIDDPSHDVVWEVAAELGVPVTTHHGSGGGGVQAMGRERNATWLGSHAMGHTFEAMTAIVGIYTSGIFARFPTLRWGFMEAGCGWLPFWLEQIEEHAERMQLLLPDAPAEQDIDEIFAERCIVTGEGEDHFVPFAMSEVAPRCVVWASDFPHFDCALPLTDNLRSRHDLTDDQRERFAATNAIEFYGISVPAAVT